MKAIITVIDDNGKFICKDRLLTPIQEEIVNLNPDQLPIKQVLFKFTAVTQLADFQIADFQKHKEIEE